MSIRKKGTAGRIVCTLSAVLFTVLAASGCVRTEDAAAGSVEQEETKVQIGLSFDSFVIERWMRERDVVSRARKHKLVEFSDVETFPIQKAKVKVLSIKRGNTLSILDKLGLNPTQFYYKIERTRHTGDDTYIFHQTYVPEQYINPNYPNLEYYSSIYDRFKEDYHIHMNDEHFEEVNEIVFPTPSKIAKVLKIDENFPTVKQVKMTKLEATGQILEYTETYKRGDYYKIKFISCDRDH